MSKSLVFLVFTLTVLGGCGLSQVQKDAIGQFSQTSSTFGKSISTQLTDARDSVINARKRVLILNPAKLPDRDKIDGALTPENLSVRVRAAEALQSYGDLLEAIVEDTQQQELADASKTFTTSLRSLDPSSKRISDDQLTAIGGLVRDIGGLLVEYKKKKALKELIPAAHDQVSTIAKLFKEEFNAQGALAEYVNGTALLLVSAMDDLLNKQAGSVADRTIVAESFTEGIQLKRKTDAIYPHIADAADQLVRSHQRLVDALKDDKLNMQDLTTFSKTVKDIVTQTKIIVHK